MNISILCLCVHCRAPRFLLRQESSVNPLKNQMYLHQREITNQPTAHPTPPTISLLPLRPKTCVPRLRQQQPETCRITSMFEDIEDEVKNLVFWRHLLGVYILLQTVLPTLHKILILDIILCRERLHKILKMHPEPLIKLLREHF